MSNKVTELILEKKNNMEKETFILSEDNLVSSEKSEYDSSESYVSDSDSVDIVI